MGSQKSLETGELRMVDEAISLASTTSDGRVRRRVVVIGGGFAGINAAMGLA
jgi:heterodisulfide reductase subunit A-like polyferredoxin